MSASNETLKTTPLCSPGSALARNINAFVVLAKPEITFMVMISTGVAALLVLGSARVALVLHAVFGTGLLAAGASSLNQYVERELDSRMRRTSRRPLPAGDLTARQALLFGVLISTLGIVYLLLTLNVLTAVLGVLTLISYVFVYTPLKTRTRLSTFIGAFPGAAPVLIGWSAVSNSLSLEAWALYSILFVWQLPHFFAIGWIYREDYSRAGMLMLPDVDQDDGTITFRLTLISTQLLIIATLLFGAFARHQQLFFAFAMLLGLGFYYFSYQLSVSRSKVAAKYLLHASVIYLPLLYSLMLIDRIVS